MDGHEGGNLLDDLPALSAAEQVRALVTAGAMRVERIVSTGQASPPGFWYDQDRDEFVLLVQGEAVLTIEGAPARTLRAGHWLFLPAHRRHRVEATSVDPAAVWLAVHAA